MSDHGVHESHAAVLSPLPPGNDLRFEKAELEYFVDEDRDTGKNIGKMLALIFCVLLVMMAGVAWWTNKHQYVGQDAFSVPTQSAASQSGH